MAYWALCWAFFLTTKGTKYAKLLSLSLRALLRRSGSVPLCPPVTIGNGWLKDALEVHGCHATAWARWTDKTEVCGTTELAEVRRWRRVKDDVSRDGSNVCVTAVSRGWLIGLCWAFFLTTKGTKYAKLLSLSSCSVASFRLRASVPSSDHRERVVKRCLGGARLVNLHATAGARWTDR
ncbi:Unannotated, partial [Lentimonas sp. CC11]